MQDPHAQHPRQQAMRQPAGDSVQRAAPTHCKGWQPVSVMGFMRRIGLCYLSRPASDHPLYRRVARTRPVKIVELGVDNLRRTVQLIDLAADLSPSSEVLYSAIDLFDARTDQLRPLKLKNTHRTLTQCDARVKLIPGDPEHALARTANSLLQTDLILVGRSVDQQSLRRAWFYIPRMLHDHSGVLVAPTEGAGGWQMLDRREIDSLAGVAARLRTAA